MAARQRKHRETHGKGLLFVTLCLLAAGVVKYSSFPAAAEFRARAAEALAGAPGMEEALGVFGGRTENAAAVSGDAGYAASSGGADDILGRDQTQFPDTADETVYSIGFHYVLPAKGTLTSSFGERLSPLTGEPGFHYGVDIAADEARQSRRLPTERSVRPESRATGST
ncbi:hypothetical protein DW766_00225 [Butyricicoccus sp. AM29-23AC]|nr:hypothetical protein DW766_00225 [Butyricicoccus sp. AM29-23AC]